MSGFGMAFAGLNLAAKLSGAKAALAKVPPKVWYALAIIAALFGGYVFHQHKAHVAIAAAEKRGADAANAAWAKKIAGVAGEAHALRVKAEAAAAAISKDERTQYDQAVARDAADAGALLLRGPGAAASHCRPIDHPGPAAAAGGRGSAASGPDAAGPQMPAGDGANVPWPWLVGRAQEHDDLLEEVKRWRDNDAKQRSAWDAMRRSAPIARPRS